ncbi:class I fructose-bisphosphate aldolase [Lyticum sinuosum]|nr:class I fructose-bisphosphate aldolase [Lyticum sinuosum]
MKNNLINKFLSSLQSDVPACTANAYRLLNHGKLSKTGYLVILPVDQGFEHGPEKSFSNNPLGYDPEYHVKLAIEAGLSAYAAPLGMIENIARDYAGMIPLILKINSNNMLKSSDTSPHQAITASVEDALRLGCIGIGLTIYPGSNKFDSSIREIREIIAQAKKFGLLVIIWSYPRGEGIRPNMNTALDISCYAVHIAALLGAHIIKIKIPDNINGLNNIIPNLDNISDRIEKIIQSAFVGKKMVLFSGGNSKNLDILYKEINAIKIGGGNGSMIGRNVFQRSYNEALEMLNGINNIYKEKNI